MEKCVNIVNSNGCAASDMEKPIKLIRASAGAGKTHYLTGKYIDLLLSGDTDSYRHILAVTFTNTATEEMKSRVIEELHRISTDRNDPRHEAAGKRLTRILHDYSGFSISTIDRFFQTVMRAFAREIGQYASYKVELDLDEAVSRAVDLMMDSLNDASNGNLLQWLEKYSFQQIENGGSWNVTDSLRSMSKLFFSEDFRKKIREVPTIMEDKAAIERFDGEMKSLVDGFMTSITAAARKVMQAASDAGVELLSLKGKSRGPVAVFPKWADGDIKAPADMARFEEALKGKQLPQLMEAAAQAVAYYNAEAVNWSTASVIRRNLYLLGIYSDIYRNLNEYLQDTNTVLLAQTTDLLDRIIDGNDTPFVYEKTGNRYEHILLDESQDTSVMQWRNFKPLFIESRSHGFSNLIVGDIKQSIYRWRGSDWKLISEYARRDLGAEYVDDSESLEENWRSTPAVVNFNNRVFTEIGPRLEMEDAATGKAVSEIYGDSMQRIPSGRADQPEGRVKVGFIPGDSEDWKAEALERMSSDIEELHSHGYDYGDITILVRKNTEGSVVADHLIRCGLDVITEDSLQVSSSKCVGRIVSVLNYLVDPDLPVNRMMVEDFTDMIPKSAGSSLFEICETFARSPLVDITPDQVPFVQAFMDMVISYQDKYGSSLRNFVKWWNESGASQSICAPDGQNAVRVMTIHKSKGLGLEAVIIPFMDEKFVKGGSLVPTIWCRTSGRFSELGLVPLKAKAELDNTIFRDQYREEVLYQYIDSINTAYVALTRARSQLVVYCPAPENPGDYKVSSFATYLYALFGADLDAGGCHVEGSVGNFSRKKEPVRSIVQDDYRSTGIGDRLSLSLRGADYFEEGVNARLRGIELHDILSKVDSRDDLVKACAGDAESLEYLSGKFGSAPAAWFDGTYVSLNEDSIVDSSGAVYRPDRILVDRDGRTAIVVDYKFGAERESYHRQVANYCSLLSAMGYEGVRGYLWYVDSGKVCEVGINC